MNYEQLINSEKVVLVEFFATWCIHCQHMQPVVEQLEKEMTGKCRIQQLDVDKNQELCEKENIQATPTFILYNDGKEVWRQSGEMPLNELSRAIEKYL